MLSAGIARMREHVHAGRSPRAGQSSRDFAPLANEGRRAGAESPDSA